MTQHPHCDVCEQTDIEGTRRVCVTEGEVEVCYECLTENASVKEIRQTAIRQQAGKRIADKRIEKMKEVLDN